jgi:hypothetical protein
VGEITWKADVFHTGFARKRIYDAYDSWYMRKQMVRSQSLDLEAFELGAGDKVKALFLNIFSRRQVLPAENIDPEHQPGAHAEETADVMLSTDGDKTVDNSLDSSVEYVHEMPEISPLKNVVDLRRARI